MSGRPREQGSASVLVIAVMIVVLAAGAFATAVAEAVAARHEAAVAADASALAAAAHLVAGGAVACELAARVAIADGAQLRGCAIQAGAATVTVEVAHRLVFAWPAVVRLNARAGPTETYREKAAPVHRPS
jgi:secretion/DNA translocation related TadE-like protein